MRWWCVENVCVCCEHSTRSSKLTVRSFKDADLSPAAGSSCQWRMSIFWMHILAVFTFFPCYHEKTEVLEPSEMLLRLQTDFQKHPRQHVAADRLSVDRGGLVALNLIPRAKFLKPGWEPGMDYVLRVTPPDVYPQSAQTPNLVLTQSIAIHCVSAGELDIIPPLSPQRVTITSMWMERSAKISWTVSDPDLKACAERCSMSGYHQCHRIQTVKRQSAIWTEIAWMDMCDWV